MKSRVLRASYTVEASAIMGIIILSLCIVIQTGYKSSYQLTGIFHLQGRIEKASHNGDIQKPNQAKTSYQIVVYDHQEKISGTVSGLSWEFEIVRSKFRPEEWIRMITFLDN